MFKEIKSVQMKEYDGIATLYRHDCGMEVLHIKNSSEELSGNFMFTTISEDNTGVAHIIEHTVLCGSEKYPVKDPFSEIYLSSPNTFLNAMTFPDKTMYPFASPLKKDFDIIFDIYADAVFAPLLRRESFEQEGVRFIGDSIDGVVFNEMQGDSSSEEAVVGRFAVKKLFEGTPAQYESGGNPEYIPDLTYEEYLKRYRKWYNPANCRLFLYGNLDAFEYMDKIEKAYLTPERLSEKDGRTLYSRSEDYYNNVTTPVYDVQTCPNEDASSVMLSWITTPSSDPFEILTLSVLTDILLGNPGAPLYKAVIESGLGDDLNSECGMESDYPVLTFSVGYTGAKKNKEKEIEEFILRKLNQFAEEGIDEKQKKACLRRQKFKLQEIPGDGYPYSVLVGLRASRFWLRGKDPISCIDNFSLFERLEKECEKGPYFENWIKTNLVDNPRRCLLTVTGNPNYGKALQKTLNDKYRSLRSAFSTEELEQERIRFDKFVNTEDSEEALACIPRITRNDLPARIPSFALDKFDYNGTEIRYLNTFTRGISYINIAFDTACLDEEEKALLLLLTRMMQMSGTKKHTYSEIGTLIKMYTGLFSISCMCGTKVGGKPGSYMVVRSSALSTDITESLELIREILCESDLKDTERLKAAITDYITDFESDYMYSAHLFACLSSSSALTPVCREHEITSGTLGYLALSKYKKASKTQLDQLGTKLDALRNRIVCTGKMIFNYTCDKEDDDTVRREVKKSLDKYPEGKAEKSSDFYSTVMHRTASKYLTVSAGIAYNSMAFEIDCQNEKELVGALLISSIIGNGYLFEDIRGKGGAYGAGCNVDLSEKTFVFYSYRDPNIKRTFESFEKSVLSKITSNDIEYTVAVIIGKELRPQVPKAKSFESFRRSLFGLTDELYLERRKSILSMTAEDLAEMGKKLFSMIEKGSSCATICGRDMLKTDVVDKQAVDKSEIVSLPF